MATSKRKRKRFHVNYTSFFVQKSGLSSLWYIYRIMHCNSLTTLFAREIKTKRIRKKCIQYDDYSKLTPMFSRWSVPIVYDNPCKKSRIKNHLNTYRLLKAEDTISPNGTPYTEMELMNLYLSNGGSDE